MLIDVVRVESRTGQRGGEHWWLDLACGHFKAVPKPRFHAERLFSMRIERFMPPKRVKCWMCEHQASAEGSAQHENISKTAEVSSKQKR